MSLVALANDLLRRRGRLYRLLGIGLTAATLHWAFAERHYSASVVFTPEINVKNISAVSSLGGLASQLGLNLPTGIVPLSFYGELIGSQGLLRELAQAPLAYVSDKGDTLRMTLIDSYASPSLSEAERLRRAVKNIRRHTDITINNTANTISIEYTAANPALAAAVVNKYVDLVNRFNVSQRQSEAKALREFLQGTALPRAASELSASEDSLARFYVRNRSFESSPSLRLEEARLQRRIAIKQQSYLELSGQLEQARVDEVQNTPIISIISPGYPPAKPSSPLWYINLAIVVLLAFATWTLTILLERYHGEIVSENREEYRSLQNELGSIRAKLGRLLPVRSRRPPNDRE